MSMHPWIHGTYTIVGGGYPPTTPHPLNTSSHNTAARSPPHPSYTQHNTTQHTKQHTTTLHNSTRVHKTTNVPVVFMAQYIMVMYCAIKTPGTLIVITSEKVVNVWSRLYPLESVVKASSFLVQTFVNLCPEQHADPVALEVFSWSK
jgi:hypothetical protein